MPFFDLLWLIFTDYTLRTVILGTSVLGMISGSLGCFAYLRQQSFLGDAIAHAALPGIAGMYLITGEKSVMVLLIGALFSSWFGMMLMLHTIQYTRVKTDGSLGIILSVFFGFGLVLLTFVNRLPDAGKAGLNKFLFGMSATMIESDVIIMASLGLFVLLLTALFWKEFKVFSFNRDFAAVLGFPVKWLDGFLMVLIVISVIIGLEAVGVVLMSAMMVVPAAAARQWTNRLHMMVILAAGFGALAGILGALLSVSVKGLPTGPTIVLFISGIFIISVLFSPSRGIFFEWWRRFRSYQIIRFNTVLSNMLALSKNHPNQRFHGHPTGVFEVMTNSRPGVVSTLKMLMLLGYVKKNPDHTWSLTRKGFAAAEKKDVLEESSDY